MKSILKSLIAFGCFIAAMAAPALCATPPPDVAVTYAFVPKERLGDAVKGKREALEIESVWRNDAQAKESSKGDLPAYPMNVASAEYSIVVFVEVPAKFALWGKIGIPVQNPKHPLIVNVNLAPGPSGIYVIDGAGVSLMRGIPESKPYEWLEVHTE